MRVLVALAVLVATEIAVLVAVGGQLGVLGLLGVLVGSALLGSWAIAHEGRRSLAALVATVRSGRPAEAEVAGGMLVALAGVLLVLPGLISDVAALVLLVPPVRRVLARRMVASAQRRTPTVRVVAPGAPRGAGSGPGSACGPAAGRSPFGPAAARSPFGPGPGGAPVIEGQVLGSTDDRPAPGGPASSDDRGRGASPGAA